MSSMFASQGIRLKFSSDRTSFKLYTDTKGTTSKTNVQIFIMEWHLHIPKLIFQGLLQTHPIQNRHGGGITIQTDSRQKVTNDKWNSKTKSRKKHASGLNSALLCIHQLLSSEYSKYVVMQALYQFLFCFDAVWKW